MQCPVCIDEMLRITERQNIEIDYCPRCRGVWLDRGELDKIIERIHEQPTSTHPADYMDTVRKRKNDDKYRTKGPLDLHTKHSPDDYHQKNRKHSKAKRANDLLEDLFDIFD